MSESAGGRLAADAAPMGRLELARGATALVPHAAGATTFEGRATVIGCMPPAAEAEAGEW
jgi:hypothetical protein